MQNAIEISSGNTFESEKTIDSQENFSEDKMDTELYANEAPEFSDTWCQRNAQQHFLGQLNLWKQKVI